MNARNRRASLAVCIGVLSVILLGLLLYHLSPEINYDAITQLWITLNQSSTQQWVSWIGIPM